MNSSFIIGSVATVGFFTLFRKFSFQQKRKDTDSSSLSVPSPPTSVSRIWKHHVFPSFHGADVRKTFLSHILESFRRKGIDSFIDNHIEKSKSIGPELVEAIKGSKIAIVLLSRNYASSSWCLDELVEIMKCREVLSQKVMTIFYEVDPTNVKKQTGDFGKAFKITCKGKTKEHVERWRNALEDVAKIAGEHSCNWVNEATMIEKITTDVSNMLNSSTPSRDFDSLVGMRTHMDKMEQLLCLDLDEVRMIGIWGPPGIGKTTIARFLFHKVSSRFQFSAIMVNIKICYPRPCLDEYTAQLQLQNQMLSQIINQKDLMISHLGVAQARLKDKKVLLVLDDVDHLGQLAALAKEIMWFGPGSRIIITTEDRSVLNAHGINHVYKVKFPSSDEAFQIFCMHAFGKKHPDDGFHELAMKVTKLAGELPLGLKVLGSALRGMSKHEWKRILPRLNTRLDGEIESIIKFSYDALCDEDKDLFLYIACLFNHEKTHKVEEVLANKYLCVRQGLHVLAEKSLISIELERIKMHTLLEKFGKETSRKQFVHQGLTKRQLLVGQRDVCELLSDDSSDSRRFIGIRLDLYENDVELNISEKAPERMFDLQFVKIYGNDFPQPTNRLQSLLQGLIFHSPKIRSLRWTNFHNICLPSTFIPEFLVELVMQFSKLQKLWEGTKQLRNLKWLDLSVSKDLKELPDLSTATNLEELILADCSSLLELPSSIGKLTRLQILNLRGCSSLLELPSSIMNIIIFHEQLNLDGCSSLVELPSIGDVTNLKRLNLNNCSSLVKLPSSIRNATNLEELYLKNCSSVVELPMVKNATNLKILELNNCSSLLELPNSIGTAINLRRLDISGCSSLVKLPTSIGGITNLEEFNIYNCSSLVELPLLISTAKIWRILNISGCSSLVKLPSSIKGFTELVKFDLTNCSSLVEFPPSLGISTRLQTLDLRGCSSLVKLPSSVGDFSNLRTFSLYNCSSLVELPSSIGNLQQLYELRMTGCSKLEALPTNINLESLCVLDLTDCSQLESFPEISTNIEDLSIIRTAIKEVPLSVMSWPHLTDFYMSYFENLKEFPHALDIITGLHLNEDIQELPPWVKGISRLCELSLYDCNNLVSLPQLSDSLSYIDADNCKSLERLDCYFNNPKVCLKFTNCFKLNEEARDLIMHTSTRKHAILPGTQVPACFPYRATSGGFLTIKLNERHLSTSLKFKACIMLVLDEEETDDGETSTAVYIDIMDKQNDLTVLCTPKGQYINLLLTEHIYTLEVEAREVTTTELVFEFRTGSRKWKIGECGLLQILEVPSCE